MREGRAIDRHAIANRLSRARHFRSVAAPALRALVSSASTRALDGGDALWRTGDVGAAVYFIDRGSMMISRPRPNGATSVHGVFGPDDCIGLSAVLGQSAYPADATALGHGTRLVGIDAATLLAAIAEHPTCAELANALMLAHTHSLRTQIEILSAGSVATRLASFLLHAGERLGTPLSHGGVRVPIAIPRATLAHIIAARSETVIRTLAAWRRQRIITTDATGYELRAIGRLQSIAHGE